MSTLFAHIKKQEFRFEEYRYKDFKRVRSCSGVFESDFVESFNSLANSKIFTKSLTNLQSGRSGKQIIETFDRKFLIKEIDSDEKSFLLSIAKKYSDYIVSNQKSLMARIYGLFALQI